MLMKTLKRALFGFTLGMAVGNVIAALTGQPNIVSPALLAKVGSLSAALLRQTLLSGLIGAAGMGGTVLYELDRWPLAAVDAAHLALVLAVFAPAALYLGWTASALELLLLALIMCAAHAAIFLIMCAIYRSQVRELNRLNERRKTQDNQYMIGGTL